jgi:hypothetical protein
MTYLWLLRQLARVTGRMLKHTDHDRRWWAWVAYYDGRIAFRQLRYVERVQKASGWEPVEVVNRPVVWPAVWTTTATTGQNSTFRLNGIPMHDA